MENSHIQWTDHTFNPWEGCTKVSPGCLHCYAEARNQRFVAGANWGVGAPRRRTSAANWMQPIKWNAAQRKLAQMELSTPRPRVFCASLADWLDPEVDIEWLADLLEIIYGAPMLDWLMLTKRPEMWMERMLGVLEFWRTSGVSNDGVCEWLKDWLWFFGKGKPPLNIWIGTTVEDQARARIRIPQLMKIPATIRFLSCEPLLEPIDLNLSTLEPSLDPDWVICGGESGPGCRPMELGWARDLYHQCFGAGVSFFMKQLGGHPVKRGELQQFPEDLRVRQFPV